MKVNAIRLVFLLAIALCVRAQQREFGVLGGGILLNGTPLAGAAAAVTAGFSSGPTAGVLIGHDLYSYLSGEIRYLFEKQDARLSSGGATASFGTQAHVVHYDVVVHARPRQARVRSYLEVGGGVKLFRGTGAEVAYRPLMEYGYLTRTQELKPMLAIGGGVKFRISARMIARVDFLDQLTRFPSK